MTRLPRPTLRALRNLLTRRAVPFWRSPADTFGAS